MRQTLNGPLGPVLVALGLALVSVPIVAGALMNTGDTGYFRVPGPTFGEALVLAAVACLVAAWFGGVIGGAVLRQHPVLGPLLAIGLAWPIAVTLVPVVASAIGIHYRSVVFCLDSCNVLIDSDKPLSGIGAIGGALQMGVVTVVPDIIFLASLWAANRAARDGATSVAAFLVALGFASLNWIAFVFGGITAILPFVTLTIGVVIWAAILSEHPAMALASAAGGVERPHPDEASRPRAVNLG